MSLNRLTMIDKDVLKSTLRMRPGYTYDQAEYLIEQASYLFPLTIDDETVFRNLMPCVWVFADFKYPRSLEAYVRHLRDLGLTWRLLADSPPTENADWYLLIQSLQDEFDWAKVGPLFLTPVKGRRCEGQKDDGELKSSPNASFFIVNGLHSALAAMTRIEQGTSSFSPVEAILMLPRVDYPEER